MGERHSCPLCTAGSEQAVQRLTDGVVVNFPERFAGPPGHVNGGVSMGALTCVAAQVSPGLPLRRLVGRLHRKLPVATTFTVTVDLIAAAQIALTVLDDDGPIVSGTVWVGDEQPPVNSESMDILAALAAPSPEQLAFADTLPPAQPPEDSPFAGCYVCGPSNTQGLRLRAVPVGPGQGFVRFDPDVEHADGGGELAAVFATAALDCTAAPCLRATDYYGPDESMLLGGFDVTYLRPMPLRPEGGWRLPSHAGGRDGRKVTAHMGLFDQSGTVYAMAKHLWITIPTETIA